MANLGTLVDKSTRIPTEWLQLVNDTIYYTQTTAYAEAGTLAYFMRRLGWIVPEANTAAAVTAAVAEAEARNGATICIPPGVTIDMDGTQITLTTPDITLWMHGATLQDTRLNLSSTADRTTVLGGTILDATSDTAAYLLNIQSDYNKIHGLALKRDPATGGYQGYLRAGTQHNEFIGFQLLHGNGFFIAGHDHTFLNTRAVGKGITATVGGDDCLVLKAGDSSGGVVETYNINVTGGVFSGFTAPVSIGSEVGKFAADGAYENFVKNVTVTGVTALNCTRLLYVKPGAIGNDYRHGLVSVVNMSNCTLIDEEGVMFRNAVELHAGRGAILEHVTISNIKVRARGIDQTNANCGVQIRTANVSGAAATIRHITVDGVEVIDAEGGIANSVSAPGYPIELAAKIENEGVAYSSVLQDITLRNMHAHGTRDGGVYIGASCSNVRVVGFKGREIGVDPASGAYAGIASGSEVYVQDADITMAAGGGTSRRPINANSTSFAARSAVETMMMGTIAAGSTDQGTAWVAPADSYVWKIELLNSVAIAQSDTNYTSLEFRNMSTGNVLATATTQVTGGIAIPDDSPPVRVQATAFTGDNAYFPAGSVLRWAKSDTGSGAAITNMAVRVHFVTYSR